MARHIPTAEELESLPQYRLVRKLELDEIVTFIFEQIRKPAWPVVLFFAINLVLLALLVWTSLQYPVAGRWNAWKVITMALNGFVLFPLLLIPLHEWIHGGVYRLIGAPDIRYGHDLSQFIFYVTAHRYVVDKRGFFIIALAPFVLISVLLAAAFLFSPPGFSWAFSITLFAHSTMCIGDFALMGFFSSSRSKEMFTFDDTDTMSSYFYEKTEQEDHGR